MCKLTLPEHPASLSAVRPGWFLPQVQRSGGGWMACGRAFWLVCSQSRYQRHSLRYAMDRSTIGFFVIIVLFIAIAIPAIKPWSETQQLTGLPGWRRVAFSIGILALTTQVAIFAFIWTRVGKDQALFPEWSRLMYPLFWFSLMGIVSGKGAARWVLLAMSIIVLALSFFTQLSV